jgi:hypothetical protein
MIRYLKLHKLHLHNIADDEYTIKGPNIYAIAPIVYKTHIAMFYEQEDVRFKDLNDAALGIFDFTKEEAKNKKDLFIEFADDVWESEVKFKKKKMSHKIIFMKSIDHLQDFINNDKSNENSSYLTNLFLPWLEASKIKVTDNRNTTMIWYAYNYCDEKGKTINDWTKEDRNNYSKYIQYYLGGRTIAYPFEIQLNQETVAIDLNIPINIESISQRFDVESQDSYNEVLINFICKEFKVNNKYNELINITKKNLSATSKFLQIRKLVNDELETQIESSGKINLDELLSKYFKNIETMKLGIDLQPGVNVKKNLAKTTRNPDRLLEKMISNKAEFKQCSTLLDNYLGSILVENLTLNQTDIDHLQTNFRLLRMQFRQQSIKNEAAVCNTVVDIIGSIKVGVSDTYGQQFCEKMREFLTLLSKSLLKFENSDTDDELEKPTHNYVNWKFRKK